MPSRALAGAIVGRVLARVFVGGILVGCCGLVLAAHTSHRPARFRTAILSALMGGSAAIAQFLIVPRIERVRLSIGGPVELLAHADSRRIDFGRLHGLSVLCLGVAMLAAGGLILTMLRARSSVVQPASTPRVER